MTNSEKMKRGLWYDANYDEDLARERMAAEELYFRYNQTTLQMEAERFAILQKLLGGSGENLTILTPFYTDYGYNCFLGDNVFLNHNCYLMDAAPIHIGNYVFIGPNFGCYTSTHALLAAERNKGYEKASPITIEDNVWIGGDVTVLPGVTIGAGSIIGAGSVVTKDVEPNMVAYGNPCRAVRAVTEADSIASELTED
ncbi:MAG: sugar O-acetyltransferase [Clostridia bacterium]|nr:sugar O-acetyltransferase [Clostridia bacterium]